MSSPIHKALFSPPPSPPSNPSKRPDTVDIHTRHGLISLKAILLPNELSLGSSHASPNFHELKARSPRTPQQKHFSLDASYPSYPSKTRSLSKTSSSPRQQRVTEEAVIIDVESTPKATTRSSDTPKVALSPKFLPSNIPSSPLSIPSALPRPLLRLLILGSLIASCALLLLMVPGARFPSLRNAALSRRLAYDDRSPVEALTSWADAAERDYVPPQIRVPHMMKRVFKGSELDATVPGPMKAVRPNMKAHPLPESHEILAIQSYLLESAYNVLPSDIDPQSPVDANKVSPHMMGKPGSKEYMAYLDELIKEKGQEVVVWYGGDGSGQLPHDTLDVLHALHGPARHPTMIPCHTRADRKLLQGIFERLSIPFKHHPLVMIGNTPIIAAEETMEDLRGSGKLEELLKSIGWVAEKASV